MGGRCTPLGVRRCHQKKQRNGILFDGEINKRACVPLNVNVVSVKDSGARGGGFAL